MRAIGRQGAGGGVHELVEGLLRHVLVGLPEVGRGVVDLEGDVGEVGAGGT